MNQAVKISLISKTYTVNANGVSVPTEEKTDVFALQHSVSMSEFYQAGLQGFKPEARFDVLMTEYADQAEIEYNGHRLTVYRVYTRNDGRVELYTTQRKGTK